MARTLLFVSADSFQVSIWKGSKLGESQYFSNDSNGREQFSTFLKLNRNPAYMLVDVIEEDFRLETIPHLMGSARKALLARKFEQYYRGTMFCQASLLQRQAEGRRDDEMMFSALTNPQRISPWLDALLANRIPLIGIYSLPNISTPLLKNITSEHVLLLSWEKDAGLRQTYFNNKRLHFSRLTQVNNSFSESVSIETPRTQQYLKSLSLPPPGEVLDVFIICHSNDKNELQARLEGSGDLRYIYLDIHELGNRFKAKNDYIDSDATPLFLHLLASKTPSSHYANSTHTHFYILWQLRRMLFLFAAVIALSGALWSALSFMQGQSYAEETDPIKNQAERIRQQTQQIQHSFANTTIPAADMKTAVILARNLVGYNPPPAEILHDLTIVLNNFSQIQVGKLDWQSSAADAAPSIYPAQVITFDGSLTGFGNDYRKALDYLERFQRGLTQRGYTVSAQKMPLDISSKGSISGDTNKDENSPAQFTLKIIWRQKQ